VDVETVQVDVLVSRSGRPVAGLTASDFLVLDSGVAQQVELAAAGDAPVNAVLVLDTSASLAGERMERLRSAAAGFVGGLREGDRVALVTFSRQVRVLSGLSPELGTVPARLEGAVPEGMTALNDGLYAGLSLAEGTAGRCALVLFTDGADNISWLSEAQVVETARDSPAVVYVVASSLELPGQERAQSARGPRETFLKKLASVTGGRLLEVRDDALLRETFESALAELRARYVLRYTPQGVPADGWHSLEVRLKGKKGDVKTRPGYVKGAAAR
jgi:VWFA-related protein